MTAGTLQWEESEEKGNWERKASYCCPEEAGGWGKAGNKPHKPEGSKSR